MLLRPGSLTVRRAGVLMPLALLSATSTIGLAGASTPAPTATGSADEAVGDGAAFAPPGVATVPRQALLAPVGPVRGVLGTATSDQVVGRVASTTVDTDAVPDAALVAYQRAASIIGAADQACGLEWYLLAAVGQIESDHGRVGSGSLDEGGVARPAIYGVALTGKRGTARIGDTDAGQLDRDRVWDRAVGPMQFLPSTWSAIGVDADGDGQRDPQDVDDAALAAAVYLCSGNDDLATTAGQRTAVYRYNRSDSYVDTALALAAAYERGEFTAAPNGALAGTAITPAVAAQPQRDPDRTRTGEGGRDRDAEPTRSSGPSEPAPQPAPSGSPQGEPASPGPENEPPSPGPENEPPSPGPEKTPDDGDEGDGPDGPGRGVPAIPSTGVDEVDEALTLAQAVLQCTLEGLVDNPLTGSDTFDRCVAHLRS